MKSNKGSNIDQFARLLNDKSKSAVPMTLRRATVKEVDWNTKSMTCIDLVDGLEHLDVRLGLGFMNIRPVIGSLVIIGIIGKNDRDTILINAVEIDQIEYQDKTGFKVDLNEGIMTINGDDFKGIVKAPELKKQIDKNTAILKKIQQVFTNWVPVPSDGGAALKSQVTQFISLPTANLENIENQKIKHG